MNPGVGLLRALLLALLCVYSVRSLSAQNLLYAEHKEKMLLVRDAHGGSAIVEENGKRVIADGRKFAFKKVDEFLPVFVSVRNLAVRSSHIELTGGMSGAINHAFEFQAEFSSAYSMENVFVVLELDFKQEKSLVIYEVGKIAPHRPVSLNRSFPTGFDLGQGHFKLHLFSGGLEILHSEQPINQREHMLDRLVASRIKETKDREAEPLFGPPAEYPAKLAKSHPKGEAVVKFRVTPRGAVLDPVVLSATDPAFGEAALATLRLWRFLPRMKDGRAIEATVNMPVLFGPQEKS